MKIGHKTNGKAQTGVKPNELADEINEERARLDAQEMALEMGHLEVM